MRLPVLVLRLSKRNPSEVSGAGSSDEYKQASAALQASVEELKLSTEQEDISRVRAEMKKLYDGLNVEFLDLKAHVWGIHVHALTKKNATSDFSKFKFIGRRA
ncbi:hypothetical protein LENED_012683 [Lentinula edodes]|uniref:Uncharacterized protein n=1 Tax=Lentinula edodes TaxID=5353 RepID=A0A1Q3ETC4_LENED|nr:hypothetical protein LENED_012683 [Lentinula edodes]